MARFIIEQKIKGEWKRAPFTNYKGELIEEPTEACAWVEMESCLDDLREGGKRPRLDNYRVARLA